ncbi:Vps51/Vps67 [Carpediemonas membranifera]|uniref:Vps51/Vps67 n=1 Tax=Carpediemonas membranifera TaxID=201153 RepID=A0A8J6AVM6_9EUKA|nr:Vps51/Vps67 [Carpediemonas membranifera]|eukprot:KAG9392715.1 Vps51/Vps67 [Carpediemonas membranifera]
MAYGNLSRRQLEKKLSDVRKDIRDVIGENYSVFVDISKAVSRLEQAMPSLQDQLQLYESAVGKMDYTFTIPPPIDLSMPSTTLDAADSGDNTHHQQSRAPDEVQLTSIPFQGDTLIYVSDLCSAYYKIFQGYQRDGTPPAVLVPALVRLFETMSNLFIKYVFNDTNFLNVTRCVFICRAMTAAVDRHGVTLSHCLDRVLQSPLEEAISSAGQRLVARVLGQVDTDYCLNKRSSAERTPLSRVLPCLPARSPDVVAMAKKALGSPAPTTTGEDVMVVLSDSAMQMTTGMLGLLDSITATCKKNHHFLNTIAATFGQVMATFVRRISDIETEPKRAVYDKQSLNAIGDVHFTVYRLVPYIAECLESAFGARDPDLARLADSLAANVDGLIASFSERRAASLVTAKIQWASQEYVLPRPPTAPSLVFQKVFIYLHTLVGQIATYLPAAYTRAFALSLLREMVGNMLVGPFWTRGPGHLPHMNEHGIKALVVDLRFTLAVCAHIADDQLRGDVNTLLERALKMTPAAEGIDLDNTELDGLVQAGLASVRAKLKMPDGVDLMAV